MTIHTDISEIIGQCRCDLTLEASFSPAGGGGVLNKFLYGETLPRGPTLYAFIQVYHFSLKGTLSYMFY